MPITALTTAEVNKLDHMCPYAEDMKMGTVIQALITASNGSITYAGPTITNTMVTNFDSHACPNWNSTNGNVAIASTLQKMTVATKPTNLTTAQINALNGGSRCPVYGQIGTLGTKIQALIDAM